MTFITKAAAVLLGSGLGLFVPCAWAQQAAPTAATATATAATAATAAAAAPISLQAALALAMEHNPGLRAAAQALAASEGALIQSRARPNPELAYSQEDTRRETRSMTLQWNQSIEIGGKREARMKAAGHGRELARAELEAAQAGLRADVRTAFANVLAGQQRVQLHQRTLEIAGSARDAAAKRVLAGKVAPLEETKARVAESSAELALAQARSGLRVARQQLAALWGAQPAAFGSAVGELAQLPVLPDEGLMLEKLEHSPQMLRAQQAVFRPGPSPSSSVPSACLTPA